MKKLKLWGGIGIGAALIIVVPVLVLKNWLSGSANGTVSTGAPVTHQGAVEHTPESVPLQTSYFSTVLPAGFVIKRNIETPTTPLTQLQFAANTSSTTDQQIAITVGQLPSGGITQLGDYHLRATDTATYKPLALDSLPAGATAFQAASGAPECTIFWSHGAQYAEISITTDGGANRQALQSTANQLLSQWSWK